jgi:peptide chain release factor subunit 1
MYKTGKPVGVVVIDGCGFVLGVADGVRRVVHRRFLVDLPHKHRRGGQSAARFGRLADEARHAYVMRAVEAACDVFLPGGGSGGVLGIVILGSAETKVCAGPHPRHPRCEEYSAAVG